MFPPCYLTWGQTMVEVIKIIETSSKMSHAYTAALNVLDLAAGHCQPTPLPETPGHSWASLGQSLLGSQLLSPESWWAQSFVCSLQESVFPVLCMFWQLYGGVNGNLLQEGLWYAQVYCIQGPCPCSSPLLTCNCAGDTVLSQSLWGLWVLVCTMFVWALQASLVGMGFDSKRDFTPPTILLGLLPCCWIWGIIFVGSNILLPMFVQQQVVILEFLQKKMSTGLSTPPSWSQKFHYCS